MKITKERLTEGLHEYIREDLMPAIQDPALKVVLNTAGHAIRHDPDMLTRLIEGAPVLAAALQSDGTAYEIGPILDALVDSAHDAGAIALTIPRIPLLTRSECRLSFNDSDLRRLKERLER